MPNIAITLTDDEYACIAEERSGVDGFVSVEEYIAANMRGLVRNCCERVQAARLDAAGVKSIADLSADEIAAIVKARA